MTHFLQDILRQPEELQRTIEILTGRNEAGRGAVDAATAAIRTARHVYLTGIGSSWHAALNVSVLFHRRAYPVYFADAAELLTFATFPKDSAMILISRSGKSTEIVQLAAKARRAGVNVIGTTNAPEGTLAKEAHIAIERGAQQRKTAASCRTPNGFLRVSWRTPESAGGLRSSARTPGTASWGWGARGVAFENDRRSWTRHSPLAGAGCRLDLACAAQHHLLSGARPQSRQRL